MNESQGFGLNPNTGFYPARQAWCRRQFRYAAKS
jgi:hypothetical protein